MAPTRSRRQGRQGQMHGSGGVACTVTAGPPAQEGALGQPSLPGLGAIMAILAMVGMQSR